MEKDQGSEIEGEKDDGVSVNIAIDGNGNSESDDQKTPSGCWRVTGPARRSSNWTEEEDKLLQDAVQRFKGKCWKKIAECLPCRTDVQCLHRWQKVLNPALVKGPWTKEEDDLIVELVGKQGNKKWSEIAKYLPGRIGKQCRERWHNHLNPEINKNPWTKEEELILIDAHSTYGNKWAEIAKFLHGRSENAIKNHWNCSLKKKLERNTSHSALDHPEFATPILFGAKTEAGNGEELMVKHDPRAGFLVNQNMNCQEISDSCLLSSMFEHSKRRDGYLQASKGGNCSFIIKEASNLIEPKSLGCREILQNQDNVDNAKKSDNSYHIKPILANVSSNGFINRHVSVHSACYKTPYLNSPLGRDGIKCTDLASGYYFAENSEVKQASPLPRDCRDVGHCGRCSSSHLIIPRDRVSEQRTTSGTCKILVDENYTGLCYEPLQRNDLKIFLSTGIFPSTDSYIRVPSNSTAHQNPRVHEKWSYISPESILRMAARTFENIPSIIRKRRIPTSTQAHDTNHIDNVLISVEDFDSYKNSLLASHEFPSAGGENERPQLMEQFASPQKSRKLKDSSVISSDNVWDTKKS